MSMAKWQLDVYRRIARRDEEPQSQSAEDPDSTKGTGSPGGPDSARENAASGRDDSSGARAGDTSASGAGRAGSRAATPGDEPGGGRPHVGKAGSQHRSHSSDSGGTPSGATIGSDSGRRRQVAVLLNELGREQAAGVLRNLPPSLAEQIAHESLLMEPPDEQERAEVMRAFGFTPPDPERGTARTSGESRANPGSSRRAPPASARREEGFALTSRGARAHAAADGHGNTFATAPSAENTAKTTPSWTRAYEALELAFGPEKADRILHKAVPEAGRMRFSFLEELDVPQLKTLLAGETEHVVSLVVSQSKPEVAARVLKAVDDRIRRNVVARVARMNSLQPEVVDKVAESLKKRWREVGTEKAPETGGGVSTLAEIMKHLGDTSLLNELSQQEPELAGVLRDELYSIEMVLRVHDRQLAEILSKFDDHSIALILKGKREEIRAKIMHNVSERRATMVSEEYRELGPQRREDVDQVTHEFVEHLRSRVEDGSLLVDDSDDRYI